MPSEYRVRTVAVKKWVAYNDTHMHHWIRTILFAVFAIGFLVSAPLVVLYTAGYRYQLGSNRVVKAGVLSITSVPKGATITLDEKQNSKRTPAVIDNLFPGDVKIEISKAGYTTWQKILPIESNESTFIPNALLFLTGSPMLAIDKPLLDTTVSTDPSRFAYLTNTNGTMDVWVRDSTFLEDQSIFKQSFHASSVYQLSWSPDSQYLLLKETVGAKEKTNTIIHVREHTIVPLPVQSATDVHFDVGSDHHLFYHVGKEWNAFGINADLSLPKKLFADDLRQRNERLVSVQSKDQSIVSYLDDKGVASIIAYLPLGSYRFISAPSSLIVLEETKRHRLIILDPDQGEPLRLNEEIRLSAWSPKEDRFLFSNGFDVKIFDRHSGYMETITRFSEPLTQIGWYPSGDEILYSKGTTLSALELDERDVRNETVLADGVSIQSFWITKDGSDLFFFGKNSKGESQLYERKLQK